MNFTSHSRLPGRSTVDRGSPGLTVGVVDFGVVVVVVREEDFGTQIRFLPTMAQTCAVPPIVRTAPTREHVLAAAPVGDAVDGAIVNVPIDTAAARSHRFRVICPPAIG